MFFFLFLTFVFFLSLLVRVFFYSVRKREQPDQSEALRANSCFRGLDKTNHKLVQVWRRCRTKLLVKTAKTIKPKGWKNPNKSSGSEKNQLFSKTQFRISKIESENKIRKYFIEQKISLNRKSIQRLRQSAVIITEFE